MRCHVALLVVAACRQPAPAPGSAPELEAYLASVARMAEPARRAELAAWKLDRAAWDRVVVEPFRQLHDRYAATFDARPLDWTLARGGPIAARRHYAGDPSLTAGQAMTRWALPTLYPSLVVSVGGHPLDAVFLHDGQRWRALTGLDDELDARIIRFASGVDPSGRTHPQPSPCVATIEAVPRSVSCANVWFAATDAALRSDRARFERMCQLATTLCDMRSP